MAKKTIKKLHRCLRCQRKFETACGLRQHKVWHARLDKKSGITGKNEHASHAAKRLERNPDGTITRASSKALAEGNKGGNRYSGRTDALRVLDSMLKEAKCQEKLKTGLRKELLKNPVGFFKQIIMPLVPKESLVRMEGTMREASLLHIFHQEAPTSKDNGNGSELTTRPTTRPTTRSIDVEARIISDDQLGDAAQHATDTTDATPVS
jgi:hypothetical protein